MFIDLTISQLIEKLIDSLNYCSYCVAENKLHISTTYDTLCHAARCDLTYNRDCNPEALKQQKSHKTWPGNLSQTGLARQLTYRYSIQHSSTIRLFTSHCSVFSLLSGHKRKLLLFPCVTRQASYS